MVAVKDVKKEGYVPYPKPKIVPETETEKKPVDEPNLIPIPEAC